MTNLEKLLEYIDLVKKESDKGEALSNAIENSEIQWGWKYGRPRGGSFARSDYWHPMYEFIWEAANIAGQNNPCWQVAVQLKDLSPEDKRKVLEQARNNILWLLEESPLKK